MPRSKGYKHLQKTRDKIQATLLVNRMQDHAMADEDIMSQSQVNAASKLINKVLPDLKSTDVQHSGTIKIQAFEFVGKVEETDDSEVSE